MLILHTDQWRWDALGCLNSPVLTPHVDRLVTQGVHFDHAVVQSPADDSVARVPLVMRWPRGVTRPGRQVEDIVELVDIVPTVLQAVGIPVPTDRQGQ